ncbi:MAG: lactate utilization protein [Treponema sp.]|nr:lactate utilization protein [Treponema sp.]
MAEEKRNNKLGQQIVKALKARHFDAYYCISKEEASDKIMSLIPDNNVVSWGGSTTMEELGIIERVKKTNTVIDRAEAKSPEERTELMRKALLCDTYLMSTNAITEDGELVNIDGNGNRTAAMMFGPKNVIIACGMNKIVKDIPAAISRARNTAAPINANRFDVQTPCNATGVCADCKSAQSVCTYIVRTRLSKPQGRIKVVLIGEALGF